MFLLWVSVFDVGQELNHHPQLAIFGTSPSKTTNPKGGRAETFSNKSHRVSGHHSLVICVRHWHWESLAVDFHIHCWKQSVTNTSSFPVWI